MLLATAMNTKGKPKAAMWEAILPVTMPPSTPTSSDSGWREVVADGENMLDAEAFIAMNRFSVLVNAFVTHTTLAAQCTMLFNSCQSS